MRKQCQGGKEQEQEKQRRVLGSNCWLSVGMGVRTGGDEGAGSCLERR